VLAKIASNAHGGSHFPIQIKLIAVVMSLSQKTRSVARLDRFAAAGEPRQGSTKLPNRIVAIHQENLTGTKL
jgi:hypothetical protein